jgi:two-component system, chemotaxis family, sensor kinase CheA
MQYQQLKNKRILVIDDDLRNIYSLKYILDDIGCEVYIATTGKYGLEVLDELPNLDAVLMDLVMPEMDGLKAIQKIREQGRFSDLPIIALTAKNTAKDRLDCMEAGASDYLSKPIDVRLFLAMLELWTSQTITTH